MHLCYGIGLARNYHRGLAMRQLSYHNCSSGSSFQREGEALSVGQELMEIASCMLKPLVIENCRRRNRNKA
jgi:hypothetical protein